MGAGEKIREIRKSRDLNISDVESKAGISEGNLSRIETGKQWPKEETLRAIAEVLECSVADFFNGTTIHTDTGPQIPVILYSQTDTLQHIKKSLRQEISAYISSESSHWIPAGVDMPENAFALEISDNAMFPEFYVHDHVIIDPDLPPKPGDFVLAQAGNETVFRKYRPRGAGPAGDMVFQLAPLNEDYPFLRSDVIAITIIGTMLEHRRYRKT